ncbi:hypothetical protein B296_00048057 [Ensete ventricosum]|uniref:Uncharacterized protein n=1 Tax=Ensete ventricosum TaxID=4639 RepID=A0A426XAE6_ENSVE|nr:hypothetical protein B296_00048057 [Ensete ventricosum]
MSPKPQPSTLDPPPLSATNPPNQFMPLTRQQEKDLDITDLESYAMASIDLIDAKLEAFESRIEDKLHALFAEFRISDLHVRRNRSKVKPKKLTREELRDRSAKGLCWHCDEPWSRDLRYKNGRLLLIEPVDEFEQEEEDLGHEENTEEELQSADCMVADGRILKCDQKCSRVRLVLQGQEIIADSFLPLDDYEAVLDIEWLSTLGDVSYNFFKLIMKVFSKGKQVILHEKHGSDVTTVSMQRIEKVLQKM